MAEKPLIQLALDYFDLAPALAMAQIVHKEVDVLEIGTPLTKGGGMLAVKTIREMCPDNLILADIKSPDVGGGEAKMAFDAGADWMTVLGAAPIDTIKLALEEAKSRPGKEMFIELTGIKDIMAQATEWRSIGIERMVYHRGWDEGNISRSWDETDLATISELIRMGFKVSVAGGLGLDMIPFFRGIDISVFVIGRAIRETPDPAATARKFRAAINANYSGGFTSPGSAYQDKAAKAIRWGVSELGLDLVIDGRECPGCNSPARFCQDTRTGIWSPEEINSQEIVTLIQASLGPGEKGAVGVEGANSFYLDVAQLPQLTNNNVLSLLTATSAALHKTGLDANVGAAMTAAQNILAE